MQEIYQTMYYQFYGAVVGEIIHLLALLQLGTYRRVLAESLRIR